MKSESISPHTSTEGRITAVSYSVFALLFFKMLLMMNYYLTLSMFWMLEGAPITPLMICQEIIVKSK